MSSLELTAVGPQLWKAFQTDPGGVSGRHAVVERWRRSRVHGVDPDGDSEASLPVRGVALRERQQKNDALLTAAYAPLAEQVGAFETQDFRLLVTDADGVVLQCGDGGEFAETARALQLMEGGRWSESIRGTNAIGTAIAEARPVVVAGCAHYVRENHGLVCYAAPIFDAYGALVGAVDATSFREAANPSIARAVLRTATALGEALRKQAWASAGAKLVGPLMQRCPTPAVLVEWPGVIRAGNRPAEAAVGRSVEGERIERICGLDWQTIYEAVQTGVTELRATHWGNMSASHRLILHPIEPSSGQTLGCLIFAEPLGSATRRVSGRASATARVGDRASLNHFDRLCGSDPQLQSTKATATRVAGSALPVLLLAETGTGKGLMAQAIHAASPQAAGTLVDLNCGALSPQLLESEMFGYAPGAFTGANRGGSAGRIEQADGGTLFLDEVAEMTPHLQAMLLKVLEGGQFYRVGEATPRTARFRLICATCRDLASMVDEGTFRSDLYYRIRGATLTLPPLRDRSDLAELALALLDELACEHEATQGETPPARRVARTLSPDALDALQRHAWPGNVRELRMALQFAQTMADGDCISRDDLPAELVRAQSAAPMLPNAHTNREAGAPSVTSPRRLAQTKQQTVQRVLRETAGNISEAARRLGVARSTVYRLMSRQASDD